MANRKVSHHRRIISKTSSSVSSVTGGNIIEFKYLGEDIYDSRPMIFVLTKSAKVINGVNINYLKEAIVQKLLLETNYKKLNNYSLYRKAFRSYSLSKIKMLKKVEYKTDEMIRKERNENKL